MERINRALVALVLHMRPDEVDDMPDEDVGDVLAMAGALEEIKAWQMQRAR